MNKKLYNSNAERQRAYRQRNGINDIARLYAYYSRNARKPRAPEKNKIYGYQQRNKRIMNRPFLAIDGEGVTTNKIVAYYKDKQVYKQNYTLLSDSEGYSIEDWKNGLKTVDCLEFLLRDWNTQPYQVGFGIGYDVTKMLTDLSEEQLKCLHQIGQTDYLDYKLKYIANKLFVVTQGDRSITLFDTFGFFQKSFIKSLMDWKIDCPQEIIDGKENRTQFSVKDKRKITKYNLIECKLLVEMMDKLRNAMSEANFLPTQWYGAGAIAAHMLEHNEVKYQISTPANMAPYFLNAYYGGRNQVLQMGEFNSIYLHDINSAYPNVMRNLPSTIGKWYESDAKIWDYPWCLYQVKWSLPENTIIAPFPVRTKDKSIHWPLRGSGWYWQPEVFAACKHYSKYIKVKRCFVFEPKEPNNKPFQFIEDYYAKRQNFIAQGSDAQLVLKLGINACYGKIAQSVGRFDRKPPYQDFFLAGYTTSQTRAMVFTIAMLSPSSIIAFSTDGVASTDRLAENSLQKALGAWEVKRVTDYFILQSGVYTYKDNDEFRFKSRGFRHKSVDYDALRSIWRKDGVLGRYCYTENRFIGIGNGLRQDYNLIGNWIDQEREIIFAPSTMEYGRQERKKKVLRLRSPEYVGESFAYELKVNWLNHQADADDADSDLQCAM